MLEDFAADYAYRSQSQLQALGVLITIVAFVCAVLAPGGHSRRRRAPFFALSAGLLLVAVLLHLAWQTAIDGLATALIWVIVAVEIVATTGVGVLFGLAASGRSQDAFGHRFAGLLAAVPVANLILFLAPSRASSSRPVWRAAVSLVLAGVVMVAAAFGLLAAADRPLVGAGASGRPTSSAAMAEVAALIGAHGLEAALQRVAEAEAEAVGQGDLIDLTAVEADGKTLRYQHTIGASTWFFDRDFRLGFIDVVCRSAGPVAILSAGGRIVRAFQSRDGEALGSIVVTRQECPA